MMLPIAMLLSWLLLSFRTSSRPRLFPVKIVSFLLLLKSSYTRFLSVLLWNVVMPFWEASKRASVLLLVSII